MPWPIMYWKEGYKGFHSDCALNHAGFRALALIPLWCRAMHPILNYVESRTNHEPNMVHGVVDGEMHFQLVIIDGLVRSHIYPVLSFLRKQESSYFNMFWTPASAGVTILLLFTKPS